MAETKQEKRTFKWGDREYLLDDLLEQHAKYENNYYDFARDRGQYDATALQGLRQAITNRINAIKDGQSFDGDGTLDTDRVDNTRIQTQKKGLFKKDKYVDQDNTEWAKYYLNQLVGRIKPYEKTATPDKGAWDINKYGLSAYLTGQGLNARDIFEKYDLRDKDNPEAARSFTQRREILKQHLTGYNNWLKGKGFDFSKNDNEWDDTFGTDLDKFVTDYDNLDNNALATQLRKFGAGDDYTTAFTSDKWDLSKSPEELDSESKKRKEEEEAKLKSEYMKKAQDAFLNNYKEEKGSYLNFVDYTNHNFGEGVTPSFMNYYADLNKDKQKLYGTYLGTSSQSWDKAYQTLMQSLRDGTAYNDNNKGIILQRYFEDAPNGFTDVGNGLYLVNESINDIGEGYVYDPKSKYFQKRHISEFANQNANIKKAYEDLLYNYINKTYGTNYDNRTYVSFKEGGILKAQLGAAVLRPYDVNEQYKEKASESGLDIETQKARDRYINSDNKSEANPNAGFTGAEIARLVSIGADITSMFLDPITGTAVGLGSTLTNFGADVADDGFQWEDVKNLGINVGFDLLGAIPLFGDAVGTGSKITRNLVKWAPRVMAGLATYQGVSNFDGMMNSWSKMTSKDSKMTVQDWRNIAQSIGLITGATRAIKNKAAQNQMKNKAKVQGVVGVNVRDKNTGEIKQLLVDGKTAETIRNHKGDAKKIQQTLSELEGYKDKFGENGTWEINTKSGSLQKPFRRTENADGSKSWELRGFRKDGKADVNDVYDFSQIPQGYGASVGYKIPGVSDKLNQWHQQLVGKLSGTPSTVNAKGVKTIAEVDAEVKALRDPVDAQVKAMQDAMTRRNEAKNRINSQLTPEKKRLQDIQTRLRGVPDEATLNANKTTLEQNIATNDANITSRQQLIDQAQKNLDKLLNKKRVPKKRQKQHKADIKSARAQLQGHKTTLQGYQATKQRYDADMAKLNAQLQDYADLTPVQANVNRLQRIQSRLGRGNHTNAYNKLQQMLADLQTNHSTVSGRQVNWDMSEILQQAGIQNAFKQGGSIDINKINKFLNYAKG